MAKTTETDLSIKGLWEEFMRMNGLVPGKIPAIQELEMKKTFYMACGMLHTKLRDEISTLPPNVAIVVMETQMLEVAEFLGGIAEKDKSKIIH